MSKTTRKLFDRLKDLTEQRYRQSFRQSLEEESRKYGPKVASGPFLSLHYKVLRIRYQLMRWWMEKTGKIPKGTWGKRGDK